jgi:hypothetical protein
MNARKPFTVPCLALSAVLGLAGCLTGTTHQDDPIPGFRQSALPYAARDGQLVFQIPRRIDPSCNGSTLVYDTLPGWTDSITYALSGDSLEWDSPIDTSTAGAAVKHFLKYGRVGSGSGLPGIWLKSHSGYKVVSGELAPGLKARMDSNLIRENLEGAYLSMHLRVTGDSMELYAQFNSAGLATASWTDAIPENNQVDDSAHLDMDFRVVDGNTVEYHGRKTGETVRVARFDNYDVDYTSDNPAHVHYHYSDTPETCPDNPEPDWYYLFQRANAKVSTALPKTRIQPNLPKRGYPVPAPLKIRGFFLN